jgi:hypothetical protein
MNPLIPYLAVPLMRALRLAPPVLNLREADLVAACKRQGLEVLGVERHASRGRDVRPFVVARKPAGEGDGRLTPGLAQPCLPGVHPAGPMARSGHLGGQRLQRGGP